MLSQVLTGFAEIGLLGLTVCTVLHLWGDKGRFPSVSQIPTSSAFAMNPVPPCSELQAADSPPSSSCFPLSLLPLWSMISLPLLLLLLQDSALSSHFTSVRTEHCDPPTAAPPCFLDASISLTRVLNPGAESTRMNTSFFLKMFSPVSSQNMPALS